MRTMVDNYKLICDRQYLIDIIFGSHRYAELILTNGKIVNVLTREIYKADIAIAGDYILMIGDCESVIGPNTHIIDINNSYLAPGFIDAHTHIESTMLTLTEFTQLSLPTGTTCLISDTHEIGKVLGPPGIKAMCKEASVMPQHVFCKVPGPTPNNPGLETQSCDITSKNIFELFDQPQVVGMGETQSMSAIRSLYKHNNNIIRDILTSSVYSGSRGYGVDGNASGLTGLDLAGHIIACGTDISCHKAATKNEALEKLRNGIYLLIKKGSTLKNNSEWFKTIIKENIDSRRFILATDHLLPVDILKKGHMDFAIRSIIQEGADAVEAIQMATINSATWLGLSDIGVLAPGKIADIVVLKGELEDINVTKVFLKGKLVAEEGNLLIPLSQYNYPVNLKNTIKRKYIDSADLKIKSSGNTITARCIGLIKNNSITDAIEIEMQVEDGYVEPNLKDDILPISVIGRHGQKDIGKAFVKGFCLKKGAIAESISYDAHNIIVIGTNYEDMATAVNRIIDLQGGIVAIYNGECLEEISLPIGGIMTEDLEAKVLIKKMEKIHNIIKRKLNCQIDNPLTQLSLLSLTTSPKWKITDKGLVDVNNYCVIPSLK